jgi:hypothetical protein
MSAFEGHTICCGDENEMRFWRVQRLWELARDLPIETVPLKEFERILDEDRWFGGDTPTCRLVAQHAKKLQNADLSYPIIISASGMIMDGIHRIVKAWMLDLTEVQVVRLPEDPEPDNVRTKQNSSSSADPTPVGPPASTPSSTARSR